MEHSEDPHKTMDDLDSCAIGERIHREQKFDNGRYYPDISGTLDHSQNLWNKAEYQVVKSGLLLVYLMRFMKLKQHNLKLGKTFINCAW